MVDDDTAKRLRDMVRSIDGQIAEQVDPALLFEIEEKLGTIPEPRRGVPLHGLQQIIAMQSLVEEQIKETIDEVSRRARLHHEIVETVIADPRVVSAMEEATHQGVIEFSVSVARR